MRHLTTFAVAAVLLTLALPVRATTQTFAYTGAEQDFVVPAGVTSLTVIASGAQGGSGGHAPGNASGGTTTATIAVTSGETLAIDVGGQGGNGALGISFPPHVRAAGGVGGYNGGAAAGGATSNSSGGGGGGAADVRQGGNTLANRIVIAGGGGGAGGGDGLSAGGGAGGDGGASTGGSGGIASSFPGGLGGGGGTPSIGGTGGLGEGSGSAGGDGDGTGGGLGGLGSAASGGGGGGGYYGGGGGGGSQNHTGGGGGGGSSFATGTATNVSMTQGTHTGNGQVVLTWHLSQVTVSNDAELRAAIAGAEDGDTITFANDITLLADLPAVQKSITIDGAGHTLDGAGAYRGFFTYSASGRISVTVENLTIRHAVATGGAGGSSEEFGGGGGGGGLGGAIFVQANVDLVLNSVSFDSDAAVGGAGGSHLDTFGGGGTNGTGGGGGMGGSGTPVTVTNGGGGGIGSSATGGNDGTPTGGASNILTGANGGDSAPFYASAGGGGVSPSSSNGGFGGGGGAGDAGPGAGGFGGGGGGALNTGGGNGGFGGGGAAGQGGGSGGFGGGGSEGIGSGGGGGGLGAGGAIFVMAGGTVSFSGSGSIANGSVTAGAGGVGEDGGNAGAGSAFGSGIFINGDNTLTFSPANGGTETINDVIADQTGNGGTAGNAGAGGLSLTTAGTLVLAGANTYTGPTTLTAGVLRLTGSLDTRSTVTVGSNSALSGTGTAGAVALSGLLVADQGQLTLGSLTWSTRGELVESIGGSSVTPPIITGALTKNGTGVYFVSLTDQGVSPGQTYTLLTFGSNAGFVASDFTVTGVTGTVALTGTALTFSTPPVPPVYGVAVSVAKGKNRATFTITNTGDSTTVFQLGKSQQVANSFSGSKPPKPGKSPFEVTYILAGTNITKALESGTAAITLPAGGSAQVVMKVTTHQPISFKRTIQALFLATSQVDPTKTASAQVKITIKAGGG